MFSQKGSKFGQKWPFLLVLNTGKVMPVSVSVFGVPNTGIPVSVYTGLETLLSNWCLKFYLDTINLNFSDY
jgi:hypothetical protein